MDTQHFLIGGIPAILWGKESDRVYLYVHGKMSRKEYAENVAKIAEEKGFQTLSFDLPGHGERIAAGERCDIFSGMRDLGIVGDEVFSRWQRVSLFACSLGACFSLYTYQDRIFENCLFQSPILDMHGLTKNMMRWSNVTEEALMEKREIMTPVDLLSWDCYTYFKAHPVTTWNPPTHILYAAKDNLQTRDMIDAFVRRFHCALTVSEFSEHPFMQAADAPIVERWLREAL